jgi:hypothetical protein
MAAVVARPLDLTADGASRALGGHVESHVLAECLKRPGTSKANLDFHLVFFLRKRQRGATPPF